MDLHFTGLSVSTGKRVLLNQVSGVVQPGEILAVMGPSGKRRVARDERCTALSPVLVRRFREDDAAQRHIGPAAARQRHDPPQRRAAQQEAEAQDLLRAPARRLLSGSDAQADSRGECFRSFFFLPTFTVDSNQHFHRAFLQYTALLRLPESMSYSDKIQHVNHIIEILDLQRCQDTSK